jgi:hypothetical protein
MMTDEYRGSGQHDDDRHGGGSDAPLPYREVTDPSYGELTARSFSVEEVAPGVLNLFGPCPRCGDQIEVPVVDRVYRSGTRHGPVAGTSASTDGYVPVNCTCEDTPHPGRPEGRVGCGAYWTLTVRGGS